MKLSEQTLREVDEKGWYVVCARLEEENEALREQNTDLLKRSIAKEEHIHMLMRRNRNDALLAGEQDDGI